MLPTQAAPPRSDRPPLTEADVRRLIADAVHQPPPETPTHVGPPTQRPAADTAGSAVQPLPTGPPHPGRSPGKPVPVQGVANDPRPGPPECLPSEGMELS